MRFGERRFAATASQIAATSVMKAFRFSMTEKYSRDVALVVAEVGMQRDELHLVETVVEHLVFPARVSRHRTLRGTAGGELQIVGSTHLMTLPASCATRPYSVAVFRQICQGPSISLPMHQNLMSCGSS